MASPAPLTLSDSFGVRTRQKLPPSPAIRSTASARRFARLDGSNENDLRAETMSRRDGILHAGERVRRRSRRDIRVRTGSG